jgi:hypothetical protein
LYERTVKSLAKNDFNEIMSHVRVYSLTKYPDLFSIFFFMKNYIIVAAIASILLVPALFADTTGTSTTSTGATSTGTTGTGTTGTGTTGTGFQCNTGTTQVNQASIMAAQQAFSTEVARLVGVKQSAYSGALSLTGAAQLSAMQSANQAFRTGFQTAMQTLQVARQDKRSNHYEFKQCKKEEHQEKKEIRKEYKNEIKNQIKDLKNRIQEIRKNGRDRQSGQPTGSR